MLEAGVLHHRRKVDACHVGRFAQELRRRARLEDAALAQQEYLVDVGNRQQPVRDHDDGRVVEVGAHAALDGGVGRRVDVRGRLVEQQQLGAQQQGPRQAEQLPLAWLGVGLGLGLGLGLAPLATVLARIEEVVVRLRWGLG